MSLKTHKLYAAVRYDWESRIHSHLPLKRTRKTARSDAQGINSTNNQLARILPELRKY